jgi:putative ABC transport system permease protein
MMMIKFAFRNLFRNPRRTMAILTTVMIGTGALFLYHGFNNGIMNQYRENTIRSRFGNGQVNTEGYRAKVFEKPWEHWIENVSELDSYIKSLPGVDYTFPRLQFFALLTNGRVTVSGRGQGVDAQAETEFFTALNVDIGKNLTTEEDGIILGMGLARALDVKVGDRVTILANTTYGSLNGVDTIVTGIFHTGAKEFDDTVFRIPLKLSQILLDTDKVESIALGLTGVEQWPAIASQIEEKFPHLESTPFEILDKVYYQNSVDFLASQFQFIRFIILFIVVLGIFNTISTGILERKQEIGNLRANGESKGEVLRLLLFEGILLGLLGSLLGIVVAYGLNFSLLAEGIPMPPGPGITRSFMVKVELVPLYSVAIILLGMVSSLVGSFFASIKVVRMEIGDLLRSI